MHDDQGTITSLVNRLSAGELLSRDDMFPVVYAELRGMVRERIRNEPRARLIGATELVQVVYVKLFGRPQASNEVPAPNADPPQDTPNTSSASSVNAACGSGGEGAGASSQGISRPRYWENRAHFFGSAARAMEQILIGLARSDEVQQRRLGTPAPGLTPGQVLDPDAIAGEDTPATKRVELEALAAALRELEQQDERLADIVRQRIFLQQTAEQIGATLGISARMVYKEWAMARAWLIRRLDHDDHGGEPQGALVPA